MLGRIKQTDLSVPTRIGRFYYYRRTVEGLQYPIRCRRPAGPDGAYSEARPGRGAPRPERDGEGPGVPLGRRVRGERRRRAPPVLDRRHRLPAVQAVRQGARHRGRAGTAGRAGHERDVGGRQPDALLRDRAPGHEAPGHAVAPRAGRPAGEGLRGEGRALLDRRRPHEGQEVRRPRQPLDRHLGPLAPARGDAERRAPARPAAREGPQVRRRAPRRHPLHPHEQGREELPPGDGAPRRPLARALEAVRRAPPGRAARGRRGLPGLRGAPGEAGGPQPPARPRLRGRPVEGGLLPRARLLRVRVRDAGVRRRGSSATTTRASSPPRASTTTTWRRARRRC